MRNIGSYQLIAELKRGEQITTFKGFDPARNEFVLIKRAAVPTASNSPALQRLQNEATLYRKLRHPNIARLLDAGIDEFYPYLALEFIDGLSLRNLISCAAPLPLDVVLFCLIDLLEGLAHIHKSGLIHRDLKPENLMLESGGCLRICDFDLALLETELEETQKRRGLTGSVGYLSPEMVLGEKLSSRSDIFSVGVIVYEMLTGTRPFAAESASQEIKAIVRRQPIPLANVNATVPEGFSQLVADMLARNPGDRPKDGAHLLATLRAMVRLPGAEERHQRLADFLNAPGDTLPESDLAWLPARDAQPEPAQTGAKSKLRSLSYLLLLIPFLIVGWLALIKESPVGNLFVGTETATLDTIAQEIGSVNEQESPVDTQAKRITGIFPEQTRPVPTETQEVPPGSTQPDHNRETLPFSGKNVTLQVTPWAFVFVNADSIGPSNEIGEIYMPVGIQSLTLKNPRMPDLHFDLEISESSPDTLTFALWDHVSQLSLSIIPWGFVYIDGEELNEQEHNQSVILPPGRHRLRIFHPNLGSIQRNIDLAAGETLVLSLNLFTEAKK